MSVGESARLMALAAVGLNDALIAVFDAKYHYNFWRPITAIRNGDIDGNEATEREAAWQPIDNTPMHPEYPCAHCILSGTIAGVIETALAMVLKLLEAAQKSWRRLDGHNQLPKLVLGVTFNNGIEVIAKPADRQPATAAA